MSPAGNAAILSIEKYTLQIKVFVGVTWVSVKLCILVAADKRQGIDNDNNIIQRSTDNPQGLHGCYDSRMWEQIAPSGWRLLPMIRFVR